MHICALHKLGTPHICDILVGTHSSCRGCPDRRPRRLEFSPAPFQGSALLSAAAQRCHPVGGVLCLELAKASSGNKRLLPVLVQKVWVRAWQQAGKFVPIWKEMEMLESE